MTGGGWFQSPAGASTDPGYSGRANFGFNAQHKTGGSVPIVQSEFRVGRLNFHSSEFESLVVTGGRAQLRGSGTVNGRRGYSFLLTLIDGSRTGGFAQIRVKIWNTSTDLVVYDSGGGTTDDDTLTSLLGGDARIQAS